MDATTVDSSKQWSESAGMTIKDWGTFATLGTPDSSNPPINVTWVWAQEYPWDALMIRPTDATSGTALTLPTDVIQRLTGNGAGFTQAPSHLSQLGLDFVCRAAWLVTPTAWSETDEPQVTFTHTGILWQAKQDVDSAKSFTIKPSNTPFCAATQSSPGIAHTLQLEQLALKPVSGSGLGNGATLGFTSDEFHKAAGTAFTIGSRANNLYAIGAGFARISDDGGFTPGVVIALAGSGSGTITVYFKALDRSVEYDLLLRHWVTGSDAAKLSITVNDNVINRYVSEKEGEGGDGNVSSVQLRNLTFGAVDYHDYLQVGLNVMKIMVSQAASVSGDYLLRALVSSARSSCHKCGTMSHGTNWTSQTGVGADRRGA